MKEIIDKIWSSIGKHAGVTSFAAIIVALGSFFLDFNEDKRFGYQDLLNETRLELDRLKNVEYDCYQAALKHSKDVSALQNRLMLMEGATMDSPLPMWLKSVGTKERPGVMLVLNEAYERRYLAPYGKKAEDYIGLTDAEFWGEELGHKYWQNDMKVISTGEKIDIVENSPIEGERDRVIKYPRMYYKTITGIAGIAIPLKN